MKRLLKQLSMAMATTLILGSIAGCSSSAAPTQTSDSIGTAQTDVKESGGEGSFKIGTIGPLTGGGAAYGNAVANSVLLAVEEINANGGFNGFKAEVQSQDDELDNQKSVNAYNALYDWGMQFLVGPTTSGCTIAVSEETYNDNMFMITPSGTAVDCIKYDNAFRLCFSDPAQGSASAKYISDNKFGTKIAVIYDSSDPYSSGVYQAFAADAKKLGLEIVSAEAFTSDSKTDFSVQLQKAKEAEADLVFLPIYYAEAALILQQAKNADYSPIFFGCDGMDGILGVKNFDTSLAEGLMLLAPFSPYSGDEKTKSYVDAYVKKFGEIPNQFGADAYDAVYAIKECIEEKGITADMSYSDICDIMKEAMTQITLKDALTSDVITWEANGEPNKEPKAFVIKDGVYADAK